MADGTAAMVSPFPYEGRASKWVTLGPSVHQLEFRLGSSEGAGVEFGPASTGRSGRPPSNFRRRRPARVGSADAGY